MVIFSRMSSVSPSMFTQKKLATFAILALSFFVGVPFVQAQTYSDRSITTLEGFLPKGSTSILGDQTAGAACLCAGEKNVCDGDGNCNIQPFESCGAVFKKENCNPTHFSDEGNFSKESVCENSKSWVCTTMYGPSSYIHITRGCAYKAIEPAVPLENANIDNLCNQLAQEVVKSGNFTPAEEEAVRKIEIRKPIINIFIPDLNFSDVQTSTIDSEGMIQIPWIGEYIAAVYRLAVSIASILAVILLIREGALIIMSGGGEEKIQGYRNIARILTGLVLAWSSYVILYNINASLVSFKPLQIRFVDAEMFNQDDHGCDDPADCDKPDPNNPTKPIPKAVPMGLGKCASDLKLAQKDRKVKINYSLFGQVDGRSYGKRTLDQVSMVVIHNGGYTAEMNNTTWQTRKAAAHYTIDRSGVIYQHAGEECVVPHAPGGNKAGIGIELNISKADGVSCNSLGSDPALGDKIKTACTPTAAQYSSLRALIDDIVMRTNVTKVSSKIVGHCELVGRDGHGDPRAFDWTQLGFDNQEKKDSAKGHACSWYLPFASSNPSTPSAGQ